MGIFSFNFKDVYNFTDLEDKEYELICYEFGKIANSYSIKTELYSSKVWDYLTDKFGIKDESNILTFSEIEMDEKNKRHKVYKYIVKCELDNGFLFLVFDDELRGWSDEDYHGYVTAEDKSNKVYNMSIYYDPDIISTKLLDDTIVKDLLECSYTPTNKNQFFIITTNHLGFALKSSYIKEMDIDLEMNYGKKFIPIHEKIYEKLKTENHGLFLLHGDPGTGKTTYIRKLINMLSDDDKTIIYIPSYMMNNVADPEFMSFIGKFKNVILLLEDAENVLANTINDRTQAVSNILNMTDGLLNDYMDVQIVATFNTEAKMIDKALKRAGRLQVNYKFKLLSKSDANILSKKLGLNKTYNESVSLAEIYEGSNQIVSPDLEEKTIGFNRN